ncbi:hypothetical protein ACW6AV_002201 [Edwardsiella piscicida]|nr:hypothetical protein [Edwardsiella piscicida]ELM3736819.1 hypothetical protein [Edwardsiella piscicida]QBB12103.1 hypothetical protein EVK84_05815 [Edwardsiella piscicida]UCQ14996.1 hypothetical protein DCE53_01495 [Edwardsiella piscicida]UCQ38183.1 hypothetical protein DCF36_01475 [Edwardsiella piscicida]WGS77401.1 hypothetical protein PED68_01555 [Edwardsiella piscicida]
MMTCDEQEITISQGVKSSDAYLCVPMDRYKNRVNVLSSLFSLKIFKSILIRLTEGEMTIYSENAKEKTVSGTSLLFLAKNQTVIIALKADEKKPLYDILELDTETIKNAYRYFF